uniref:Methyltransferase small domain-containing protein n=1 Tax=Fagus sylvatica TaxID=28930 RepID=A0A2N9ITL1_FAGSY
MPFRIAQIRLVSSHPEVYEPCDDSFALVDALLADKNNLIEHQPTLCMEVGCGSGYIITSLALILGQEGSGSHYIATDINPHAVRVTSETLAAHGVHAELINTDIALGLEKRLAGLVDVMVVNPPYVPTPEDEVGREGIASAWAGGIVVQRSTEEESLHIIKFWRDLDAQEDAKQMATTNKTASGRVMESVLSQFSLLSSWISNSSHSS